MEITDRGEGNVFVDRAVFLRQMFNCLSSEEWKKALECSEVHAASAQWGMAFCANYAAVHTPYMTKDTLEKVIIDCSLVGKKVEDAQI